MDYRKHQDTYIVRMDRGEEVVDCLKRLCRACGISLAQVSAIGAADRAEIGLYNVEKQQYIKTELEGEMEVISILGSVTVKDGDVYLYGYTEDEDGNPILRDIEDDDEFEAVCDRFDEVCDEEDFEEL